MDEKKYTTFEKIKAWLWYRKLRWGMSKKFFQIDLKRTHEAYKYHVELEMLKKISQYIKDGGGSFRALIYGYLNLQYTDAYLAGGMDLSNAICTEEKCPLLEEQK